MIWLIKTALALHNFLTLTTLGGFSRVFPGNRDLLAFGGVWALRESLGPNRQKNLDLKKIEKHVEILFLLRFQKICFGQKRSDFFSIQPLVPPIGAVRTEKA